MLNRRNFLKACGVGCVAPLLVGKAVASPEPLTEEKIMEVRDKFIRTDTDYMVGQHEVYMNFICEQPRGHCLFTNCT